MDNPDTPSIPERPGTPSGRWPVVALCVIVTLVALMLWQWLDSRSRIDELRRDFAKRLTTNDVLVRETQTLSRQNQEFAAALQARLSALETIISTQQSQQVAIETMYQELSRSRDERVLAEVEQTITIAAQQLQLAGNVEAALIALNGADARLARTAQPQFLPLRKLIARDIANLTALPVADVSGMAMKLEGIVAEVDNFPLASERRPKVEQTPKPETAGVVTQASWWRALIDDIWNDVRQLIRIERVDHVDVGLLPPAQSYFLRENVKLRLVNTRLALLARDGRSFREDSKQVAQWLDRYFDTQSQSVQAAIKTMTELSTLDIVQQAPSLNETLAAVRNFKLGRK